MAQEKKPEGRKKGTRVRKTAEDYKPSKDVSFESPKGFQAADSGDMFPFAKIGDTLEGKYMKQEEMKTGKGKSTVIVIQQATGVLVRAFMSHHLKKIFKTNPAIKVGMQVLIRLKDVRELRTNQMYKVFEVFYK